MRARNLKPGFFRNEELAEMPCEARLLFAGLWCLADKAGRLLDRPKRIKIELFPADTFPVEPLLALLAERRLIERYQVNGESYIQVVNFLRHQHPHKTEAESILPPPPSSNGASTVTAPLSNGCRPADSLIPDLLIPDSAAQRPERTRGTRVPEPFEITDEMRAWAAKNTPSVGDLRLATEEFVDYWRGVSGKAAVKVDWLGTWRNRMRELEKREAKKRPGKSEWY